MIARTIVFFIAVCITVFIVIMYPGSVPPVILGLELCVGICSLFFLILLLYGFSAALVKKTQTIFARETWVVPITVKNHSFLPLIGIRVRITVRNSVSQKKTTKDFFLKLPARSEKTVELSMKSEYCGIFDVMMSSCTIYEPLYLFGWTKRKCGKYQQVILPRLIPIEVQCTNQSLYSMTDSDEYDSRKPGDDPSEVLRFREYMLGDRMSQINWKMSVRKDTLFVKERSLPLGCAADIIVDTRYTSAAQADAVITAVYSISWAFVQQTCRHRICWYEEEQIVSHVVSGEEEVIEMIRLLMAVPIQKKDWKMQIWEERQERSYQQILLTSRITVEEADIIFDSPLSKKQMILFIQEEDEDNKQLKEQYGENCYQIHVNNIENELSSIYLQV